MSNVSVVSGFYGDPMRQHSVYVQKRAGGEFFASCSTGCGSDPFPNRTKLDDAEADARAHGALRHLYPREELVAWECTASS